MQLLFFFLQLIATRIEETIFGFLLLNNPLQERKGVQVHQKNTPPMEHSIFQMPLWEETDLVRLAEQEDSSRFEIVHLNDKVPFETAISIVIQACKLLVKKNDRKIFVGLAGPSGAGKAELAEKICQKLPDAVCTSMKHYSRVIDGNVETDYKTLLDYMHAMKEAKTFNVSSSRVVIIMGRCALDKKLRPFLDLQVSLTAGNDHDDLVKWILAGTRGQGDAQEHEQTIYEITEKLYPRYKEFIEPDLQSAHIKIVNKLSPFLGMQTTKFMLKSSREVSAEQIRSVMLMGHTEEVWDDTYDVFLLPPGVDPATCSSYMKMRYRGRYFLMFEERLIVDEFMISPRIMFGVSDRLLRGLKALGYTIAGVLKASSRCFGDDKVYVTMDLLGLGNRPYVQVMGKAMADVRGVAERLGLKGSYISHTYVEQLKLQELLDEEMTLPGDHKTKLSIDEEMLSSPPEFAASNQRFDNRNILASLQGAMSQLSEQISILNSGINEVKSQIVEDSCLLKEMAESQTETHRQGFRINVVVSLLLGLACGGAGILMNKRFKWFK